MNNINRLGLLPCVIAAMLGYGSLSMAAETTPDQVLVLPSNFACEFPLQVEIWEVHPNVIKEFKDKNGFVRSLSAGKGSALRFTNLDNNKTFSTRPNGSVNHTTTYLPDGSYRTVLTGHTILILFPTDVPAGPSTTLHVGRVVFTSDIDNNFTVIEESKNQTDICAAIE